MNVNYTNHVHPGENVMALTYVKRLDENITGDLECLVVTTLGVKNIGAAELENVEVPTDLFTDCNITTRQVERICKEKCPQLKGKIVVQAERKIIRQASRAEAFLL